MDGRRRWNKEDGWRGGGGAEEKERVVTNKKNNKTLRSLLSKSVLLGIFNTGGLCAKDES